MRIKTKQDVAAKLQHASRSQLYQYCTVEKQPNNTTGSVAGQADYDGTNIYNILEGYLCALRLLFK